MQWNRSRNLIRLSGCLLVLWLAGGCIVKDSPAPGCVESIGLPGAGGCQGKTAIIDLNVETSADCIMVEANNCNGGVLEVRNSCSENLILEAIEIPPGSMKILDLIDAAPRVQVVETSNNFAQTIPGATRRVELTGSVGEQPVKLTLTKTKPLCE